MFCPRCGVNNADDARFCRKCAHAFAQPAAPRPPTDLPYPGYQGPSAHIPPLHGYQGATPNLQQNFGQPQGASGRAITSLVLMLVAFFAGCGPFLSIPALILGKLELDAIRAGQAPKAGETLAKFGFYGGIAVTIIYCGLGILYGLLVGFAGIISALGG